MKLKELGFPKQGQALYEALIAVNKELQSQLTISEETFNQVMVSESLGAGEPLARKMPPQIREELFHEAIHKICLLYIQYAPARGDEINEILNLRHKVPPGTDLQSFQKRHPAINGNLLQLVLENAYRPYYTALAERLMKYTDLRDWKKNYCPVCGKKAALASLDEAGGQRMLWCSFCTTGWPYQRLSCIECDNRDHEDLSYFYLEDDRELQIQTCNKCKSYIKTLRRTLFKPEDLPLIDAQTAALDILAEQQGYRK